MGESTTRHRLTDIDTDEVSVVDFAANNRKFLIVKSRSGEGRMTTRTGPEVQVDAKGSATVVKVGTEATPPATAPKVEKSKLSPVLKANLKKSLTDTIAAYTATLALVDAAEEVAGVDTVPSELVEKAAPATVGMASIFKAELEKAGFKQFTPSRLEELRSVHTNIGALLEGVTPPAVAAPATVAAPAATAQASDVVESAVKAAMAPVTNALAVMASNSEKVVSALNKQAGDIQELKKGRVPTNAGPSEGAPAAAQGKTKMKKSIWSSDIAAEREKKRTAGKK